VQAWEVLVEAEPVWMVKGQQVETGDSEQHGQYRSNTPKGSVSAAMRLPGSGGHWHVPC
jgi:hypothetical protein